LILIPQLKWLASELDIAIKNEDADLTRRHLDNWRGQAAHVRGLLLADTSAGKKQLRDVQESVALAFTATTSLLEGKRPVLEACKQARESIGSVCNELSIWVAQQSTQSGRDEQ
jgi:hypothetical protein